MLAFPHSMSSWSRERVSQLHREAGLARGLRAAPGPRHTHRPATSVAPTDNPPAHSTPRRPPR